jgi:DNA-directed RNA polymerase specialized sigma24 family protein
MSARSTAAWDDAIRRYDRNVYLSVLALGLAPDRACEITQAAWTRLIEQHARGGLVVLQLPGLAIRQARFLALNELQRVRTEQRVLSIVPDEGASIDVERQVQSREQVALVLEALATCSSTARKVFGLIYGTPDGSPAKAAAVLGLSLQRVRQILCETRAQIRSSIKEELP